MQQNLQKAKKKKQMTILNKKIDKKQYRKY